jgi:PAS domain S-box-containing protein
MSGASQANQVRVLALDDEEHILELYREFLTLQETDGRFDLVVCRTAAEAVEIVRDAMQESLPFALAFLDVRMLSGPDGMWAAEEIRKLDNHIQIVMVTAYADTDPEEMVQRVPPPEKLLYLKKPFAPEEIRQFAVALTAKWHHERRLLKVREELEVGIAQATAELLSANQQLTQEIEERKQAVEALRQSEERYRGLIDSASDIIYEIDLSGHFTFFNPVAVKATGFSKEDLNKKHYLELVRPDFREETQRFYFAQCKHMDSSSYYEFPIVTRDGIEVWLGQQVQLIVKSNEPVGFHAIARDITERKQAEEALRQSEEKYRDLVESTSDWVWSCDPEGRQTFANKAVTDLLGYDIDEILGTLADRYMHPEDRDVIRQKFKRSVEEKRGWKGSVIRWLHKDGSVRYFETTAQPILDSRGDLIGFSGIDRDITQRKRTEEALRESEERFRSAFSNAALGMAIVSPEGRFLAANSFMWDMLGYSEEELLSKNVKDVTYPDDLELDVKRHRQLLAGEVDFVWLEKRYVHKDGAVVWGMVSSSVLRDPEGRPVHIVAHVQDITERKKAEMEKTRLERQLLHAQKMEAVGTLAGGIAHDFNNLLQAVQGYAELLLLSKGEDEAGYRELQEISRAAKRGGELTRQLLTFSRKEESRLRPVDLNREVLNVKELLLRTIPKMIEIKLHLAGDLKAIDADPGQIEQVLMNLAVNAKDSMLEGGRLVIETENVVLDELFCMAHLGAKPGEHVLLTISDTGHGIEPETMEHIFEPFFTTKGVGEGTGLGLATVYGIVKSHDGFIMCTSQLGKGSSFKVYFPVIEQEGLLVAPGEVEVPLRGGSETILLVDDEYFIRDLGEKILSEFGYRVITAPDGESALEFYGREGAGIDLVILDLIMPGVGGRRCLEELLQLDSGVKVLIASGYSPDGPTRETLKAGAQGFVGKPFEVKELLTAVRQALDAV